MKILKNLFDVSDLNNSFPKNQFNITNFYDMNKSS